MNWLPCTLHVLPCTCVCCLLCRFHREVESVEELGVELVTNRPLGRLVTFVPAPPAIFQALVGQTAKLKKKNRLRGVLLLLH